MANDVFYDEVRYRKALASQARHRKGSRGGRKCNLPSDRMTEKQWKERCGQMVTYRMGVPLSWNEFREMPADKKEEYIRSIREKFNANSSAFCKMFGVTPSYFSHYLKREGVDAGFTSSRMTPEETNAFSAFTGNVVEDTPTAVDTAKDAPVFAERVFYPDAHGNGTSEGSEKSQNPSCAMDGFSIRFSGKLDLSAIYNSLRTILGNDAAGTIEIVWKDGE